MHRNKFHAAQRKVRVKERKVKERERETEESVFCIVFHVNGLDRAYRFDRGPYERQ